MDIQYGAPLRGRAQREWEAFLAKAGLDADPNVEFTLLIWEEDEIIATGSRQGNILKCIAVDEDHQGEGLTATLITELRKDAFARNIQHLFLYTKPKNRMMFEGLFFYPVAQTADVLLMESRRGGIRDFVTALPKTDAEGIIGAAVMNCNPFTYGHRYLIETAAAECDHLHIFVLSEDKSRFPAADRLELVRQGTADLKNVSVHPTGPYLISSATFPDYFIQNKSRKTDIQCRLDLQIFAEHFAPAFGITRRYVGQEPLSEVTNRYNQALKAHLPELGISVVEFPRKCQGDGITPISASAVRSLLEQGRMDELRNLVPDTTYQYLKNL